MRSAVAGVVLACLLLVAAAASGATPAPNVKGTVVRTAQSCPVGEPCDPPPPALYVVFTRSGRVTRVRLGPSGGFAVHLAAGVYAVSTAPPHAVTPASLRVPRVGVIHPRFVQRNP
jgi:hypothetical protein